MDDRNYQEWYTHPEMVEKVSEIEEFIDFMERKVRSMPDKTPIKNFNHSSSNPYKKPPRTVTLHLNERAACPHCKSTAHSIYQCESFRALPVKERASFAQSNKLCNNCLSVRHFSKEFRSKKSCRECGN